MKKIILVFTLMFLLVGCSGSNYTKLNYEKLTKKLDNKDTFILLVNDNSEDGKLLKSTLNKVLTTNNLEAYELDSTKITEVEKNKLRTSIGLENISIVFIKDGIDPSKLVHITDVLTTENDLEKHLENLGFIKK